MTRLPAPEELTTRRDLDRVRLSLPDEEALHEVDPWEGDPSLPDKVEMIRTFLRQQASAAEVRYVLRLIERVGPEAAPRQQGVQRLATTKNVAQASLKGYAERQQKQQNRMDIVELGQPLAAGGPQASDGQRPFAGPAPYDGGGPGEVSTGTPPSTATSWIWPAITATAVAGGGVATLVGLKLLVGAVVGLLNPAAAPVTVPLAVALTP